MKVDSSWTLFLDRDGVINKKIENNYVKSWKEFEFICGSLEAIGNLSKKFGKIILVTNQRGIGKGIMEESDLFFIHDKMLSEIKKNHGRIDKIYFCADISEKSQNRKPNIGMALMAKKDYPEIDFNKSVIIGDSESDIQFGKRLGMKTILIQNKNLDVYSEVDLLQKNLIEADKFILNE